MMATMDRADMICRLHQQLKAGVTVHLGRVFIPAGRVGFDNVDIAQAFDVSLDHVNEALEGLEVLEQSGFLKIPRISIRPEILQPEELSYPAWQAWTIVAV